MSTTFGCGQSDLIKTSDGKITCSQCKKVMPDNYLFQAQMTMNKTDFDKLKKQLERR